MTTIVFDYVAGRVYQLGPSGWEPAEPIKAPRHCTWLQRIVDWLYRRFG